MHLKDLIKVYDEFVTPETISSLIKWLTLQNYGKGGVAGDNLSNVVETEIRDVEVLPMINNDNNTLTFRHWSNFLGFIFKNGITRYSRDVSPFHGTCVQGIDDISILKYEKGGHYRLHTDSVTTIPRQLSCILMLNNDYEGGNLRFADPKDNEVYLTLDVKPGRLIIWPSNFAFPHGVTPVTKGKRYVVVAWAN